MYSPIVLSPPSPYREEWEAAAREAGLPLAAWLSELAIVACATRARPASENST